MRLTFGKYDGHTYEWLFFNAPWYAQYIYDNEIHEQPERMDGECFLALHRRACGLTGECRGCNERPISRLGLTWQRNGNLGMVGLYCSECEYMGGSWTAYHPASFFVEAHTLANCDQLRIAKEIRRHYIGDGRLTQSKMEEFFHNHANFSDYTLGLCAADVVKE